MPNTIIESVLTGQLDPVLLIKWLNNEPLEDVSDDCVLLCCNRSEFVAYFLSYLRSQTDSILQTNSSAHQMLQHQSTPEKLLSSRKHQRSISDPTYEADRSTDSLTVQIDKRSHESPSREKKRTGRRVKTKLFTDEKSRDSMSSDDSRLSNSADRIALTSSTPMKNGLRMSDYPNLTSPVTPHSRSHERCDTPRLHRHARSQEKSCLGDYLVTAQKSSNKKKKGKNISDDSEVKVELDLSNSDIFPEIGARKSSSLKGDKRRIKPTNIDRNKKSLSLNSFNSDCFQQPSPLALEDNAVFKQQSIQPKEFSKSFDAERSILKQERQKLMEKFSTMNNVSSPKAAVMPQIKITQKDSLEKVQSFVKSESCKVTFREKLDVLVDVYDALLKNNLILSMNTEIYFLISIILSKQYEDDYSNVESNLTEENVTKYLLKTIHNSTYFAVKSLWYMKKVLEVILDKNSLKLLGENKSVRSFYPELAKFLLNSYSIKCETDSGQERRSVTETRASNGVICFNMETDNIDNFPSMMSFQNFKKQRDMFYEILRWYNESFALSLSGGGGLPSLRARVKALLAAGGGAPAAARLAALLVGHMVAECLPNAGSQESRLSLLSRRLTRPAAADGARPPAWKPHEAFYRDLLRCAECAMFRAAARDALQAELAANDHQPLPATDTSKEYIQLSKKLCLLAKFLGYLTSLPYHSTDIVKVGARQREFAPVVCASETDYTAPKEKVLENCLALRSCSQPTIDLKGILTSARDNGRLCITLPWLVQYLSMLDYTTLRTTYYRQLLHNILDIYVENLKMNTGKYKKNTIIYLKSVLGYLFTLPHFPQELFYEKSVSDTVIPDSVVDFCDIVDESVMLEMCPSLREVNALLTTSKVGQEMGSFRHITPVSLTLNPEERMRNKEKELQARLEEEFLKSLPASWRRALELVTERVAAHAVRELAPRAPKAAERARVRTASLIGRARDQASLLRSVEAIYLEELTTLRSSALEALGGVVRARCHAALGALLPAAPPPLRALAAARTQTKVAKWVQDHWSNTAVLCKNIEAEIRHIGHTASLVFPIEPRVGSTGVGAVGSLGSSGAVPEGAALTVPKAEFEAVHVSVAEAIINLKEQICLILEGSPTPHLAAALRCAAAGGGARNAFRRPPAARALAQLAVDLGVVMACHRPSDVSEPFLSQLEAVWAACCDRDSAPRTPHPPHTPRTPHAPHTPPERDFGVDDRAPTPVSDEEVVEPSKPKPQLKIVISPYPFPATLNSPHAPHAPHSPHPPHSPHSPHAPHTPHTPHTPADTGDDADVFSRILCPRNIAMVSRARGKDFKSSMSWAALARLAAAAARMGFLSDAALTEQCVALYRQDWAPGTLEQLSRCLRSVVSELGVGGGRLALFLQFLADYCADMRVEQ